MKTTLDLITDVTRLAMTPTATGIGTLNTDILAIANMELSSRILPLVLSINEEYNVQTIDVPIIAGQSQYRMPDRAMGSKLRDVRYIQGGTQLPLPRIEIEQLQAFTLNAQGVPYGFWLEAGSINLVPVPPAGGALRIRYYTAPRKYVEWNGSTTSATIGIVASVQGYYTVNRYNDTVGATPTLPGFTTPLTKQVDIISSRTPYEYLAIDSVVTTTGTPRFTVPSAPNLAGNAPNLSPNIRAGDIFASGDTSPIVQLPDEAYPLLVARVAINLAYQLGDFEKGAALEKMYLNQEASYLKMFSPRVDGAPKKMQGLLQNQGYGTGYGWNGFFNR